MSIEFLPAAENEFLRAKAWYRRRSPRAARDLETEVFLALDRILAQPHLYAVVFRDRRVCPVHRFPYHIIFRDDGDKIIVIAVAHERRKPGYWRRRT